MGIGYQTSKSRSDSVDRKVSKLGFIVLGILLSIAICIFALLYELNPTEFSLWKVIASLSFPVASVSLIFYYYKQQRVSNITNKL